MTQPLVTVEIQSTTSFTLIMIAGEIDLSNRAAVETSLLQSSRSPIVLLDLSRLDYADSSGVAAFLSFSKALDAAGSDLYVVAPPHSAAATILKIAPVPGVRMSETREQAIREMQLARETSSVPSPGGVPPDGLTLHQERGQPR
jgi:anti-anti-sigma factor